MGLRNSQPIPFQPATVTDALDGSLAPSGSMAALVNLIPDPTTLGLFIPRPASDELTDFTGFSSPGFISVMHVSGVLVYGMIATALVPGYDQPFCYNTETDAFITITGTQDATTLPLSPATSGAWTPPIMELVGTFLVVTHPGFPGGVGAFFGWIDVSNPAAPVWHAGNTAPNALPSVPVSVAQFNGRAWYACGNDLVFSDSLLSTTVTNASQVLTLGDNEDITALAGLPLSSSFVGGVIQALIAFKGATIMYQITGDSTTNDLAQNTLNVATGTNAPNTIVQTTKGLGFISPEGLRIVDFNLIVSDPIGISGMGVSMPFIYAAEPSRMVAAANATVIRISVENGVALGTPFQEWWYDFIRQIWTGPHTFPASMIHAFTHAGAGNHASFIMAPEGITGKLFDSHPVPDLVPSYTENGTALSFEWTTSILPDTNQMAESAQVETTIKMSLPAGISPVTVTALDENTTVLNSVQIASSGSPTIWGAFLWGAAPWRGVPDNYRPRQVPWTEPVVFRMLQISVTGDSINDFRIGTLHNRYEILGYLQQ